MGKPKDRPPLRFMVGDDVVFQLKDFVGWHAGTVEELWFRKAKWPDRRPSCPYRVHQKSSLSPGQKNNMVEIDQDDHAHIRVMHNDKGPKVPLLKGDVPLPEPKDPLRFLYQPFPENTFLQSVAVVTAWKTSDTTRVGQAKDFGEDGILMVETGGSSERTLFLPNIDMDGDDKEIMGEPAGDINSYIVPRIEFRRPLSGGYPNQDCREAIFHSLFPEEASVEELRKNIHHLETEVPPSYIQQQRRCEKLLNLGDALTLLYRPMQCTRDFEGTMNCYTAAAMDLGEKEFIDGTPATSRYEGLPEAMCAKATVLHYSTERFAYGMMHNIDPSQVSSPIMERPMLGYDEILKAALRYPALRNNVGLTVSCLSAAVKRGWFSMLAFGYGMAFNKSSSLSERDIQLLCTISGARADIQRLQMAHRHHQITLQVQEGMMANTHITQYGLPSAETIALFAPKVITVLQNMPVCFRTEWTPALGPLQLSLDLHISFFELPIPPSSSLVCVLVFCPATGVSEILRIPDELQLFPFAKDTFQWLWHRIAFLIHLGLRRTHKEGVSDATNPNPYEARVRPTTFRLKNVSGDLQFASFLQTQCFQLPGTVVELVEVDDTSYVDDMGFHEEDRRLWWPGLKLGISELKKGEINGMRSALFPKIGSSVLKGIRCSPLIKSKVKIDEVIERVADMKRAGNSAYGQQRYVQARKHYLGGIAELQKIPEPTRSGLELAGTLLSNQALCGLEIAKTQQPDYGVFTLKEVVVGCDIALANSRIAEASSAGIIEKLQFRRDLAAARQPNTDPAMALRTDEVCGDSRCVNVDFQFNLRLFRDGIMAERGDAIKIVLSKNVRETPVESVCPICYEDFSTRLANRYVVELPCRHLYCGTCFLRLKRMLQEDEIGEKMQCSMCRGEVKESLWDAALMEVVEAFDMKDRMEWLPLNSPADRLEVLRSLFVRYDLDLDDISKALDDMLYLNNCGSLWQVDDLTWQDKAKIYNEARRPVLKLEKELHEATTMCEKIYDTDSVEYKRLHAKKKKCLTELSLAKANAGEEIFSRINMSDSMGKMNSSGEYQVDFHGLHVAEARTRVEDMVVPVLPVVGTMVLITGRGAHSPNKIGRLQPAVQKYIKQKHKATIECEVLKKNWGALRVRYKTTAGLD